LRLCFAFLKVGECYGDVTPIEHAVPHHGEMARLTLARKIAAIALTLWKKEERFDAEQLKPQAA